MEKLLHIIKTKSWRNDGRLLKWITSLKQHGIDSDVYVLEDRNKNGILFDDNIKIIATSLFFRKFFPKSKGKLLKVPEYTLKSIKYISSTSYSVYVFHDLQNYLTLFFYCIFKPLHKKKLVWDLHELPHSILSRFWLFKQFIRFILTRVDLKIHTNIERRDFIANTFGVNEALSVVLNNFPTVEYHNTNKAAIPLDLKNWLGGCPYILWMGSTVDKRNFIPVLEAYKNFKDRIRMVILGNVTPEAELKIKNNRLEQCIYSQYVAQSEIVNYVDNALFSIVFYKHVSPNNFFCEPNRLYQLIARNIPVIVGANPPMISTVMKYQAGIVLNGDGSDIQEIKEAMAKMLEPQTRQKFQKSMAVLIDQKPFNWEEQFRLVAQKIETLIVQS